MRRAVSRLRHPQVFRAGSGSLLDLLDHVLNQGVVLGGELVLGLANVDLVYARLWVLLCAAHRVLPTATIGAVEHSHRRRTPRHGSGTP
jgi:hypothetical protein